MEQVTKRKADGAADQPDNKKRPGTTSDTSDDSFDWEAVSDMDEYSHSPDSGKEADSGAGGDSVPFFGLPAKVKHLLKKYRRIDQLYEWQEQLMHKLLQDQRNVIYCVPTSGGKTLVAEIMLMREMHF
jgi:superfamily II RNA helicase